MKYDHPLKHALHRDGTEYCWICQDEAEVADDPAEDQYLGDDGYCDRAEEHARTGDEVSPG